MVGVGKWLDLKKEQKLVISEKESSNASDEGLVLEYIHSFVHGKTSIISLRVPEILIFQDKGTIRIFSHCPVTHPATCVQSPGQYDLHSEHVRT